MDLLGTKAREAVALLEQALPRVRTVAALAEQIRTTDVQPGVPSGWRIERRSEDTALRRSVEFDVIEVGDPPIDIEDGDNDRKATTVTLRWSRRDEEWTIHPGSSTSRIEPGEARARAAALVMAAAEYELLAAGS